MHSPTTAYLLSAGWLPAPTTTPSVVAWQHPALKVPRYFTEQEGLYDKDFVRVPVDVAVFVQLVLDRLHEDHLFERLGFIQQAVFAAADTMAKIHKWRHP